MANRGLFAIHTSGGVRSFSPRATNNIVCALKAGSMTFNMGVSFWGRSLGGEVRGRGRCGGGYVKVVSREDVSDLQFEYNSAY